MNRVHAPVARLLLASGVALATPCPAAHAADSPPVVSPTQERVLGDRVVARFLDDHPETDDADLAARADAIGRRLSPHTERPDVLHRAVVVTTPGMQAFAFPGGTVAVTEELARSLDDDELAFSLAHEMAHGDLRHALDHLVEENFDDRHAEMEADRFGALYAARAGFAFRGARRALEKLGSATAAEDDRHPSYESRLAAIDGFETELRRAVTAFDLGRKALEAGRSSDAIDYLTLFVASFPRSLAGRTDLGIAYLARWRERRPLADGLEESVPLLTDPGVRIRGGFDDLDGRNARSHLSMAVELDPASVPARIALSMVLLREGRTAEAREVLRPAADDSRLGAEVLLAEGNAAYLSGSWEDAVSRYEEALRLRPEWKAARQNLAIARERARSLGDASAAQAKR